MQVGRCQSLRFERQSSTDPTEPEASQVLQELDHALHVSQVQQHQRDLGHGLFTLRERLQAGEISLPNRDIDS